MHKNKNKICSPWHPSLMLISWVSIQSLRHYSCRNFWLDFRMLSLYFHKERSSMHPSNFHECFCTIGCNPCPICTIIIITIYLTIFEQIFDDQIEAYPGVNQLRNGMGWNRLILIKWFSFHSYFVITSCVKISEFFFYNFSWNKYFVWMRQFLNFKFFVYWHWRCSNN